MSDEVDSASITQWFRRFSAGVMNNFFKRQNHNLKMGCVVKSVCCRIEKLAIQPIKLPVK